MFEDTRCWCGDTADEVLQSCNGNAKVSETRQKMKVIAGTAGAYQGEAHIEQALIVQSTSDPNALEATLSSPSTIRQTLLSLSRAEVVCGTSTDHTQSIVALLQVAVVLVRIRDVHVAARRAMHRKGRSEVLRS